MTGKTLKVLFNNDIPRDQWYKLLSENSYASPFQTPDFFDLFNSVTRLSSIAIAIQDSNSLKAMAVITMQKESGLKGFFSRRAIIYGGPLLTPGDNDSPRILLNAIIKFLEGKVIYVEIRNLFDYSEFNNEYKMTGWSYKPYLNFKVKCKSEEIIWENLNRLRKRQIKKAINNNVIIGEANNIYEVRDLYSLLSHVYITRIKKPIFGWDFFQLFYNKNLGKVFIVKKNNKVIGGHFCPINNNVIYDWYGCGLDQEYKDFAPSTMAVFAALKYGAKNGFEYLDFMGAGSPYENYGVRDFKAQFGGNLVEYGRFVKILNPFLFHLGLIGLKVNSICKK